MLLGVILMFCFGILSDFGEKSQKCKKLENLGIIGLLRRSVGNLHRSEAEVQKWHTLSMPQHSYYSH